MKQHITVEQLNELSEAGKKNLSNWCASHGYFVPGVATYSCLTGGDVTNACNDLREAVKEVLNEETTN